MRMVTWGRGRRVWMIFFRLVPERVWRSRANCEGNGPAALGELEPRLGCVQSWAGDYMPDGQYLARVDADERAILHLFLERLGDDWSLQGLSALAYGVPKQWSATRPVGSDKRRINRTCEA